MAEDKSGMLAVDIIARRLYDAGCRFAFGIPGGEVIAMIDALDRVGIRFILTKHENNAGFMAEGVYHLTGAPGILVTTVGPGLANGFNVVANAEQDRVPLIVLTGSVDPEEALTYNHQVFDHMAVLKPVTKGSFALGDGAVDVLADRAVRLALDDRPGPVHIDLPMSRQNKPAACVGAAPRAVNSATAPASGPELEQAKEWLAAAQRPIMIAGLDVLNSPGGAAEVAAFCERFNIPLITSYKAKGIVPEDAPLALGGAGLSPTADKSLLPLVKNADLILLAGYDPIEMRTGWRNVWDPRHQNVVEIAAATNDHYMHQSTISFVCDIAAGLRALGDGVSAAATWTNGAPAAAKEALAGAFGQNEAWGPAAIVETVRAALPRNGVATVDSGAHRILLSQVWSCFGERQLLQSTGLCTMGCALPLAIGAKVAEPDRPVVCFTGDAGLEMILGELATLRDLKLAVPVVVFVDKSLALIELKQRGVGLKNLAVDFDGTDFAAVGQALGGRGVTVASRDALASAMQEALAADTFTVLACTFDRKAYDGRL
ncbi:thiamine pyrophosphate-binding protein [Hwanghaeella sp.]|uniref:thiamine pyrophosphate-binding protein n=1 Tax=Hwanghaeella sp. TaxID=2605943 RepID=UPI003CCB7CAC